jgi:hypothetical protein
VATAVATVVVAAVVVAAGVPTQQQ